MKHVDISNGFIAEVADNEEIKVTPPKVKGGLKLSPNLKKNLDKYSLEVAADYFNQAILNIQQAQKIIAAVISRIDEDLNGGG